MSNKDTPITHFQLISMNSCIECEQNTNPCIRKKEKNEMYTFSVRIAYFWAICHRQIFAHLVIHGFDRQQTIYAK